MSAVEEPGVRQRYRRRPVKRGAAREKSERGRGRTAILKTLHGGKAVCVGELGLTCERDGVATQLTCVGCGEPICPGCMVRTPIGLKCAACTGVVGRSGFGRSARRVAPVVLLAVVALPLLVWLALGAGGSGSRSDDAATVAARDLDMVNNAAPSRIGEDVRSGPFTFTVTSVECAGREVGTPPETRVAQGRFCLLYMTVRNTSDRPEVYPGPAQIVADTSARRYHPGVMETGPPPPALVLPSGVKEITTVRLNPATEVQGVLIFDMPVDAKPAVFEFHPGPRTAGVNVRLDVPAA